MDLRPILEATRDDVREFSTVSGTPINISASDNINQSGAGAHNARSMLTDKARDRMMRATPAVRRIARLALAADNKADLANTPVEVMWAPIDMESMDMRGQAAVSAKAVGVPWEIVLSDFLKLTPDTIARAKKQRVEDLMYEGLSGGADDQS